MQKHTHNTSHKAGILSAWQEGVAQAAHSPETKQRLAQEEGELMPRFAEHYRKLRALPRRARRAVQSKWKHTLAGVALLMTLGGAPAIAATINVGGGCTLVNAITTANTDTNTRGCVLSDALGGADTIILPSGSIRTLRAVNTDYFGDTGLPVVSTEITIQGNGSTIKWMAGSPDFRILAVSSSGNLTLQDTTVSGGSSSTASGGSSSSTAGGVDNRGIITLTNSTVSGNFGDIVGAVYNRGTMTLTNSTISGNSSNLYSAVSNLLGTMTIINSTVSGNSGTMYGAVINYLGTMTLSRTLVSGNTGGSSPEVYNFNGTINVDDFNLFGSNGSSGISGFTLGATDIVPASGVMVSDILAPLALNAPGSTQTHALVTGSPAIDASPDDAACQDTDQRGIMRPQGVACDIGAFELVACAGRAPTTGCTVNGVAGQLCVGTSGRDRIVGTSGDDVILGMSGNDVISGGKGDDLACGDGGNDLISGGPGNDELRGIAGRDTVNGEDGRDRLFGGGSDDTLNGGNDNDFMDGLEGTDTCDGGTGTDRANRCETVTSVP